MLESVDGLEALIQTGNRVDIEIDAESTLLALSHDAAKDYDKINGQAARKEVGPAEVRVAELSGSHRADILQVNDFSLPDSGNLYFGFPEFFLVPGIRFF